MLTAPVFDAATGSSPSSPLGQSPFFGGRNEDYEFQQRFPPPIPPASTKSISSSVSSSRGSTRKSRMVLDIACLPEGVPLDLSTLPSAMTAQRSSGKPPPSPLNMGTRQVC